MEDFCDLGFRVCGLGFRVLCSPGMCSFLQGMGVVPLHPYDDMAGVSALRCDLPLSLKRSSHASRRGSKKPLKVVTENNTMSQHIFQYIRVYSSLLPYNVGT